MTDMHTPELSQLLDPLSVSKFFSEHWQGRYHLAHGPLDRLLELPGVASIGTDVEKALALYSGPVMVYGDVVTEVADGLSDRLLVRPDVAVEWLHKGAALEMDFADMYLPTVRRWIGRLRQELGLPEGASAKAVLYAGEGGAGLHPHFDAYCNFVLQLSGRKAWRIGTNNHVVNALTHYEAAEAPYLPDELRSYWSGPTTDVTPPDLETVELTEGSLLFMPRGEWHATASSETSLALNLTFGQPSWLDLALAEIRSRLVTSPRWRALATAQDGSPWQSQEESREVLSEMLSELRDHGNNIDPEDVMTRASERTDQYHEVQRVVRQVLYMS